MISKIRNIRIDRRVTPIVIFIILLLFYNSDYEPIALAVFLSLITLSLGLNIYSNFKYLRKKSPLEIRFPTLNDTYSKITSLTFGGIIFVGFLIKSVLSGDLTLDSIVGLLFAALLIINGMISTPRGQLLIRKSRIRLNGIPKTISLEDIGVIRIKKDSLSIIDHYGRKIELNNIELDEQWITRITGFLQLHVSTDKIKQVGVSSMAAAGN